MICNVSQDEDKVVISPAIKKKNPCLTIIQNVENKVNLLPQG